MVWKKLPHPKTSFFIYDVEIVGGDLWIEDGNAEVSIHIDKEHVSKLKDFLNKWVK